jgi:signal transduction histidine kinase/CheY-like chemotaxis protein
MAACMLFSMLGVLVGRGRHTCPGFHYWTAGNLCAAFALLLFGLRGIVPDWISILLADLTSIAACCLVIEGARRFRGLARFGWLAPSAGVFTLAALWYFRFGVDDLNTRVAVLSIYMATFGLLAAKHFYSGMRTGYRLSLGFTGTVFTLFALGHIGRVVFARTQPPMATLFEPSPVFALLMFAAVLGIVGWSFGFFLINQDFVVEHLTLAQFEANAMAERAARADAVKSEFLANVSHEIRTPMNGIIGLTELLLESPLDHNQRDHASTVLESGQALLDIVNELLDISKIEAGKIELVEKPFDPREIVGKTVELLSVKARNKGLKMTFNVDANVPRALLGDAGRLRQVLTNLAGNALKFTDRGEVSICVTLDEKPAVLRFTVTDTGPGIPQSDQARLFERFEQLKRVRQNGAGLGLSISKELAHLMGGKIGVISEEGRGSTFWFTAAFKRQSTFEKLSLRVLVVDDNLINQRVATGLLRNLGCETRVAGDGPTAVELLSREPFDLVLIDCQMPDMDGFETASVIRQKSDIPIIAMTGSVRDEDRLRCLEAGMDGHIAKPVSLNSITETVNCYVLNRA